MSTQGAVLVVDDEIRFQQPIHTVKRYRAALISYLWISYGIVREQGGELFAAGEPGAGTTFSFALPSV